MTLNSQFTPLTRRLWDTAVRGTRTIATALLAVTLASGAHAATAPSSEPLLQSSNFTYLGGFALPSWANGATYGTSFFEYGGHALTEYTTPSGQHTLYMEGHAQHPGQVAQVVIPSTTVNSTNWSSLPMATIVHNFVDATAPAGVAPDPTSCAGNPSFVYGMLAYNGRLIMGDACSYGGSQTTSTGVRSLDLGTYGFQGWFGFTGAVATPRALGGPMTVIPAEWQSSFGGPALTGNCCISVTGTTSAGPSATVFNPDDVGNKNPIPGKTVLFYTLDAPVCGAIHCEATQNSTYNLTTVYGGMAFPAGTRSVLFVTATGTGSYCYGSTTTCNDPILADVNGPHAPPYRYQILAYDANDLVAVKNGTKAPGDPKPYAIIPLNGMSFSYDDEIKGAAFDPSTNRLYIAQNYGATPRIEVYQISGATTSSTSGGTSTPTAAVPDPPSAVTVQ